MRNSSLPLPFTAFQRCRFHCFLCRSFVDERCCGTAFHRLFTAVRRLLLPYTASHRVAVAAGGSTAQQLAALHGRLEVKALLGEPGLRSTHLHGAHRAAHAVKRPTISHESCGLFMFAVLILCDSWQHRGSFSGGGRGGQRGRCEQVEVLAPGRAWWREL